MYLPDRYNGKKHGRCNAGGAVRGLVQTSTGSHVGTEGHSRRSIPITQVL